MISIKIRIINHLLFLLFMSCLLSGCDLFNNLPENDLERKIDDKIAFSLAAPADLKIESIPGSVNTVTLNAAGQKQGYGFNVFFTANPEWTFTGWEAVFSENLHDYLNGSRNNLLSMPTIEIIDAKDENGNPTGEAKITVFTGAAIILIPHCVERPFVVSSNIPLNFTDRKVTNYPINIWFSREIDPDSVGFNNIIITAETNWGHGQPLNDVTRFFNDPVVNGRQVTISRNLSADDSEFVNLNITVRIDIGTIYDRFNEKNTGQPGRYTELGYGISHLAYRTAPRTLRMEASAGRNNTLIPGSILPLVRELNEEIYFVPLENGERTVYFLFDANALEQSINRDFTALDHIRITEFREGDDRNISSNFHSVRHGLHSDIPELTARYQLIHGRTPYIVRHTLMTTTDGIIQLALQPTDTLGNLESFEDALKVRVRLDTTSAALLENLNAEYNHLDEKLIITWMNPVNVHFAEILLSWGIQGESQQELTLLPTVARYEFNNINIENSYIFSFQTRDSLNNRSRPQIIELNHAEKPLINTHPQDGNYSEGDPVLLTVSAEVNDGGTLTYQWYSNTGKTNLGGTPVNGATNESFSPPSNMDGTFFYYAVVTNTNNAVIGARTAASASDAAEIIFTGFDNNARQPTIEINPADETFNLNDTNFLFVTASVNDGGSLSYQWFSNTVNSNVDGTVIAGAISSEFNMPASQQGIFYYYVIVTNTNITVSGNKIASRTSNVAVVTVLAHAAEPVITSQPQSGNYAAGEAVTLLVNAVVSDGGTLSYQWYSNSSNSSSGGTLISGADSNSYDIPTGSTGTFYYYVIVSNTNNNVNGNTVTSRASRAAVIGIDTYAQTPIITVQPQSADYYVNDPVTPLSVTANVYDGGNLTFQWFSNTENSNTGGTPITGVTGSSYVPQNNELGISYYYVEITNTNYSVSRDPIVSIVSDVAEIKIVTNNGITIIVDGMSEWELLNQTQEVSANTATSFSVRAVSGVIFNSYQWYLDGGFVGAGATYTFNQAPGIYELVVVVRSTLGEERSGRCRVTVVRR